MTDSIHTVVERYSKLAVLIAPLGSCSGDSRWEAAQALREAATLLLELQAERDRIERNRDMWKGQCERQAAQLTELRAENVDKAKAWDAISEKNAKISDLQSALSRTQSETIERCALVALETPMGMENHPQKIASAIRSLDKTGSDKIPESRNPPSTLNTRTE